MSSTCRDGSAAIEAAALAEKRTRPSKDSKSIFNFLQDQDAERPQPPPVQSVGTIIRPSYPRHGRATGGFYNGRVQRCEPGDSGASAMPPRKAHPIASRAAVRPTANSKTHKRKT